eukprot:765308-Hanusia_phi.AAC.7
MGYEEEAASPRGKGGLQDQMEVGHGSQKEGWGVRQLIRLLKVETLWFGISCQRQRKLSRRVVMLRLFDNDDQWMTGVNTPDRDKNLSEHPSIEWTLEGSSMYRLPNRKSPGRASLYTFDMP